MDYLEFIENIIIVIGLACTGGYFESKYPRRRNLIWGLLLGFGTIIIMQNKITILPGRFVDFRYVTMTYAGFFGGIVPAMIAASISAAYRVAIGGAGMLSGVITVFAFGLIGNYLRKYSIEDWNIRQHVCLGLILTTIALFIMLITPPWSSDSVTVVEEVALPLYMLVSIGLYTGFRIFFILRNAIDYRNLLEEEVRLLDLEPDSTIIRDLNSNILFWNKSSEEFYGWTKEETIGKCSHDLLKTQFPMPLREINEILLDRGRWEGELIHTCKDGSTKVCRSCWLLKHNSGRTEILELNVDITDVKQMGAELQRLSNLQTVGEMAAGISHEVRNPMTTVRGYLQYFLRKDKLNIYHEQFKTMIEELDRANSIITEFLSLAKNKHANKEVGNLNGVLETLVPLLEADALRMGHAIHVKTAPLPDFKMERNEIRQLVLNLVRNGLEAMTSPGKILIRTYVKGTNLMLAIQDSGNGIPDEVLAKIGTPFFTTKENGTGLGLSICYKIAEKHNATISIETSTKGTTFTIGFPGEACASSCYYTVQRVIRFQFGGVDCLMSSIQQGGNGAGIRYPLVV